MLSAKGHPRIIGRVCFDPEKMASAPWFACVLLSTGRELKGVHATREEAITALKRHFGDDDVAANGDVYLEFESVDAMNRYLKTCEAATKDEHLKWCLEISAPAESPASNRHHMET